ncbi:MAG TPA: hypothetical protein VK633_15095 [Verrucomicrobiae bacterium]|nr:hypothetical protein [Verrucomicrobiae bacterium]
MEIAELTTLSPPDRSWKGVIEKSPPPGRLVLYRTAYYQMMGYLNRVGCWMGSDGKEEDLPVMWWRDIQDDTPSWPERTS